MKVVRSEEQLREFVNTNRSGGRSVGFVPTMGALHEGHLSLVRAAREENDLVLMSIFVNPLQFAPHEDFTAYPRDEERDLALAQAEGVAATFVPSVDEMHPPERVTMVSVPGMSAVLEGASRPGHFDGVCTVVAKLLNQVEADRAYFGQKDAQQIAVVKRMVRDLSFKTEIVARPTVRETDGLAMSSRNAYLDADERATAGALFRSLKQGQSVVASGGSPSDAERAMTTLLENTVGLELDYAVAVDPESFADPSEDGPLLLAVAARVGPARLIDNLLIDRRGSDVAGG